MGSRWHPSGRAKMAQQAIHSRDPWHNDNHAMEIKALCGNLDVQLLL